MSLGICAPAPGSSALLALIFVTLVAGVGTVAAELRYFASRDAETVLHRMLVGMLLLVAVVEVFKTTAPGKSPPFAAGRRLKPPRPLRQPLA